MQVELIFQIAAIGILVSIINHLLVSSKREELAMLVTVAGLIIVMLMVLKEVRNLFDTIKSLFGF
jgi:stage III sporulation protein AC